MAPFTEKRFIEPRTIGPERKDQLLKIITDRLRRMPEIEFAYVHGSFATSGPFRDIDVAVYTNEERGFAFESDLSYELSSLTGYEVEVKVINHAPVAFQMAPLSHGKLLLSVHEAVRTDFIENTGRRYREYAHFRNVFMEAIGGRKK